MEETNYMLGQICFVVNLIYTYINIQAPYEFTYIGAKSQSEEYLLLLIA